MRGRDYMLAMEVRNRWHGLEPSEMVVCPLLEDLERLIKYLDDNGITRGEVIDPCPECGEEHRWALLNSLMHYALEIYPPETSKLLTAVDKRLESVRALYGGEEGLRDMNRGAEKFFTNLVTDKLHKP